MGCSSRICVPCCFTAQISVSLASACIIMNSECQRLKSGVATKLKQWTATHAQRSTGPAEYGFLYAGPVAVLRLRDVWYGMEMGSSVMSLSLVCGAVHLQDLTRAPLALGAKGKRKLLPEKLNVDVLLPMEGKRVDPLATTADDAQRSALKAVFPAAAPRHAAAAGGAGHRGEPLRCAPRSEEEARAQRSAAMFTVDLAFASVVPGGMEVRTCLRSCRVVFLNSVVTGVMRFWLEGPIMRALGRSSAPSTAPSASASAPPPPAVAAPALPLLRAVLDDVVVVVPVNSEASEGAVVVVQQLVAQTVDAVALHSYSAWEAKPDVVDSGGGHSDHAAARRLMQRPGGGAVTAARARDITVMPGHFDADRDPLPAARAYFRHLSDHGSSWRGVESPELYLQPMSTLYVSLQEVKVHGFLRPVTSRGRKYVAAQLAAWRADTASTSRCARDVVPHWESSLWSTIMMTPNISVTLSFDVVTPERTRPPCMSLSVTLAPLCMAITQRTFVLITELSSLNLGEETVDVYSELRKRKRKAGGAPAAGEVRPAAGAGVERAQSVAGGVAPAVAPSLPDGVDVDRADSSQSDHRSDPSTVVSAHIVQLRVHVLLHEIGYEEGEFGDVFDDGDGGDEVDGLFDDCTPLEPRMPSLVRDPEFLVRELFSVHIRNMFVAVTVSAVASVVCLRVRTLAIDDRRSVGTLYFCSCCRLVLG